MTTKRSRRLGLALLATLATVSGLLSQAPAGALPAGTPKVGMVCTPGSVSAGTHTFNLVANSGTIQTPDGNTVFMWSYSVDGDPDFPAFQSPGPVLCVTEGETVEINLRNDLTPAETTSIVFPGQDAEVTASGGSPGLLTTEVAPGNTITYTFTADEPGTYLYESGSDIEKQVEMGLYGALIVRPSAVPSGGADPDPSHYAYNDSYTRFDPSREFLVLLADIDPDLHHAVEVGGTYDFTAKHDRYFTINGRSFPDTIQENGSALLPTQPYGALVRIQPNDPTSPATNQPALIRMLNAGTDNHPFHPHGNHTREIAQDGRLLVDDSGARASTEHFGETIGSGQTEDFLLRWDDQLFGDNWNPNTNPLPVAQPNYRNLTFKDGLTWYSGSPYLGYKGTLPTGTTSLNVCGEWYFPLHSHALNEFTNFDEGFGGMGTLLRVDPAGGCFTFPGSTNIVGGVLKGGTAAALGVSDNTYYQVNPKTTTLSGAINTTGSPTTSLSANINATQTSILVASNTGWPAASYYIRIDNEVMQVTAKGPPSNRTWTVSRGQLGTAQATHLSAAGVTYVIGVASAAGFPTSGSYYVSIDNEVMQVTGGQGTRAWTVSRGQLGSTAATHANGATVTALANDWYATFSGVPAGSQNLKVTYEGKNCGNTTGAACTAIASNLPQQTTKICDWTVSGAAGCSTSTSAGWVTLPAPQGIAVGSTDVSTSWTLAGLGSQYIGTGSYKGQVRVLVHTQRWTGPPTPTAFSTWGDFMNLVYDAP